MSARFDGRGACPEGGDQFVLHLDHLFTRALTLTRSRCDAWDLVHDTIERGILRKEMFRPGSNHRAWLCTIMLRLFIDRQRGRRPQVALDEVLDSLPAPTCTSEPPADWERLSLADVNRAMSRLDRASRSVLTLRYGHRQSYRDIARRLGLPDGTVASRLMRARGKLRDLLANDVAVAEPQRSR